MYLYAYTRICIETNQRNPVSYTHMYIVYVLCLDIYALVKIRDSRRRVYGITMAESRTLAFPGDVSFSRINLPHPCVQESRPLVSSTIHVRHFTRIRTIFSLGSFQKRSNCRTVTSGISTHVWEETAMALVRRTIKGIIHMHFISD